MKKLILSSLILTFAISAFAADVTGKWNGKLNIDLSGVKKMIRDKVAKGTAEEKKKADQTLAAVDAQQKMLGTTSFVLNLIKGGTLTLSHIANGKTTNETGKWSLKGNTMTLSNLSSKNNGPKELTATLSKDGKSLFIDLTKELKKNPASAGPGGDSIKGSISFKKA